MRKFAIVLMVLAMLIGSIAIAGASQVEFAVEASLSQSIYYPGDTVTIAGRTLADGRGYSDATVIIKTENPEGSTIFIKELLTNSDGQFATSFKLDENVKPGNYVVSVNAVGCAKTLEFTVFASESSLELDKDTYYRGQTVKISGTARQDGKVQTYTPVTIKVLYNEKAEFVKELLTDTNGKFSTQFTLDSTAALGTHIVQATLLGQTIEKSFKVATPPPTDGGGGGGGGGGGSVPPKENEIISVVDPQKAATVSSKDGSVTLQIPAGFTGELPKGVTVTVAVSPLSEQSLERLVENIVSNKPADMEVLSQAFEFTATYEVKDQEQTQKITQFVQPLRATFKVDAKVVDSLKAKGIDPEKISLFKVLDDGTLEFKGGRYNPQTGTLTVDMYGFSKYIMAVYNKTFSDLANHWAKKDIEVLAAKQIIKGVTDKEFAPEADITRAEFSALLVRLLNVKANQTPVLTFVDVKPGDWYYNAVAMAVQAGLVSGRDAKTFAPNDKVTRQEMAAMIGRALVKFGKAQALNPAEVEILLSTYTDKEAIAEWATDMSAVAIKQGIISGRTATTFVPAANAKRAEAAAMLKRLFDME